jgi:hypothetical protein
MSDKKFWFSIVAVWFVLMVTDFLFHGVWLRDLYMSTPNLWRSMDESKSMMKWIWVGQLIFAWAFVWVYSQGINKSNKWGQAFRYSIAMFLVAKVPGQLIMWATSPYPFELIWKWALVGWVQVWLSACVMTWTLNPIAWVQTRRVQK